MAGLQQEQILQTGSKKFVPGCLKNLFLGWGGWGEGTNFRGSNFRGGPILGGTNFRGVQINHLLKDASSILIVRTHEPAPNSVLCRRGEAMMS